MRLLIIYAHPSKESFSRAILDVFSATAAKAGHSVDLLDLYAEKFDPVLTARESKGENADLTKNHQERILKSEALVLIFPIWWYRAPAILEGWFDKTLTSGFAYRYIRSFFGIHRPIGLLPVKKAIVLETYGGPRWFYWLFRFYMPWLRLKWGVLRFCGIRRFYHLPLYSAPFVPDEKRKSYLEKVKKLAFRIK